MSIPPPAPNPSPDPSFASTSESTDPPEPSAAAPTFDVLPLSAEVRRALSEMEYVHPTPVQLAVWEPATRGKDAVVQARTGTGKTAAFGLPIVDQIVRKSLTQPQVLALCPTRELALQVAAELERLGKHRGIGVAAIYGGAPMQRQIDLLASGVQVVVGTPGRVLDHLRRGTFNPAGIRMLVLDECDEMLSMGFERELTAILEQLPQERQTVLFSATLPPDIERIAKNKLRSPEFITLSGDHIGALEIQHFVYMVAGDKLGSLVRILEVENPESAIVFCNTRDETENVAQALKRNGYLADWLNGDLPQSDREKVMSATRESRLRFLVATDVAARGIDISHLTHVINYDFPVEPESYVHRTGRTGRAGRTGTAISLVTPRDIGTLYFLRLQYKIRPLERQLPTAGELKTRAEADLVQMLAEAFAPKGTNADDLALARRLITHDRAEEIVAGLLRDHLAAHPRLSDEATSARRTRVAPPEPPRHTRGERSRGEARRGGRDASAERRPPRVGEHGSDASFDRSSAAERGHGGAGRARDERDAGPSRARASAEPLESRAHRGEAPERDEVPRGRRGEDRRGAREGGAAPRARGRGDAPSAAGGAPQARPPRRHADFSTWQPPEEEGDDEPILRGPTTARSGRVSAEGREETPPSEKTREDFVELYVSVGRRDGARAAEIQRAFEERAGLDKGDLARIRVRERHTFVSVRRAVHARAIESVAGMSIAGKPITVEIARERGDREQGSSERAPQERGDREQVSSDATTMRDAQRPGTSEARTSETTE